LITWEIKRIKSGKIEIIKPELDNSAISERLAQHTRFIEQYELKKGKPKYINKTYGFPVITNQELKLGFNALLAVDHTDMDKL